MAIDTRMPEWMARKNFLSGDAGVSRDIQSGMQIGLQQQQLHQRNREFAAAQEMRVSQLRSIEAYREAQINTLLMKQRQIEAESTDTAKITAWMRDPRQPPPTDLQTPKGLRAVKDVQDAFATTEIGNAQAAARKGYADKIKDLDAMGTLRVTSEMDKANGQITPEVATLIDAETLRIKGSMANVRVLDEFGELYVKGSDRKPAYLQNPTSGALHKLPNDYSEQNPVIPLEVDGKVIGYGVRNASGGITQLREQKVDEPVLSPAQRQTMNAEFGVVKKWWDDLKIDERRKPEMQAEMKKRLKEVQDRYATTKRVRVKSPSGKIGHIPESQLQDALKQGYTPAE